MHALTRGAIEELNLGRQVNSPTVQVIDVKRIPAQNGDRHRLILSDGNHYMQAMLATQQNALVESGEVKKLCVVTLIEHLCNVVQNRKIIIVLKLRVHPPCPDSVIGSPQRHSHDNVLAARLKSAVDSDDAEQLALLYPPLSIAERTQRLPWRARLQEAMRTLRIDRLTFFEGPRDLMGDLLEQCCHKGKTACAKVLLAGGAPADYLVGRLDFIDGVVNGADASTPLLCACSCMSVETDVIIAYPPSFSPYCSTFLSRMQDISRDRLNCAKLLLRHGASLDAESAALWGGTALNNVRVQLRQDLHIPKPNMTELERLLEDEPRRRATSAKLRSLTCLAIWFVLRMRAARRVYAPGGDGFVSAWASFNAGKRTRTK